MYSDMFENVSLELLVFKVITEEHNGVMYAPHVIDSSII